MTLMKLSQETREAIQRMTDADKEFLPGQLGIDHLITGCPVYALDPFGVGVGVTPRYIQVRLRGEGGEVIYAYYRGGIPGLAVGDELTVVHLSEGDRYEVSGPSGAGGASTIDIHDHSDNTQGGQNLHQILELEFEDPTELTINAGVVTRTQVYHTIDTQGGAAADDLDTVNGGATGDLLIIRPEDDARTIVVKHNTGNIWMLGGADVTLDDINDHILLIYDGTMWCSVDEDGAGGGGGPGAGEWMALAGANLDFEPDNPAVVDTAGTVTEYATIALAVAGAVATDMVVIPPGTYDETITLKAGVRIVELFTDTVVINRTSSNVAVTCVDGGYIDVYEISVTRNTNALIATIDTNATPTAGNTCVVRARRLTATNTAETSNARAAIIDVDTVNGTLNVYADIAEVYCGYNSYYLYGGGACGSGEINLYVKHVEVESLDVQYTFGGPISSGTLTINLWGGDILSLGTGASIYGVTAAYNTFNFYNFWWYIYDDGGSVYMFYLYGDTVELNCRSSHFHVYATGDVTAKCLWNTQDGVVYFWNFSVLVETPAGTGVGIDLGGGATNGVVKLRNGWVSATTTDLYRDAGLLQIYAVKHYTTSGQISYEGHTGVNNYTVGAGAITVIPNAAGDVAAILTVMYAVSESAGGTSGGTATCTPGGSVNLYNDGVDVLALAVGAGGDVTLQRTAGAATFDVSLNMVWI